MNRKFYIKSLGVALLLGWALFQQLPMLIHTSELQAQGVGAFRFPTVSQNTTTSVKWTAGTLNNGGHAVTVTASTASVTTSKTDCSAPGYASCNFVVANSAGSVSVTTALATARAAGNTILAYVETSTVITRIAYPQQSSIPGVVDPIVQSCATTSTCAATLLGTSMRIVTGSVALVSASPSAATVTGFSPAFTSSSTYNCTASPVGASAAIAAAGIAITNVSGSSITLTGPNTVTTVIGYICIGQ